MSLLGSQVFANDKTPLWVSNSGGVITGNLTVDGDVTATEFVTQGGGLRVETALGVSKMFVGNVVNQSFIQSDDPLYFTRLGGIAQTSLSLQVAPAQDIFTTGIVDAKVLKLADTGTAPTVGRATLVAGTATVSTTAADVTSYILLTHTNLNTSTAVGTLRVSNKGANNFTVVSMDATAGQEAGDLSDFDWCILNGS
jgi:hypothetical protein